MLPRRSGNRKRRRTKHGPRNGLDWRRSGIGSFNSSDETLQCRFYLVETVVDFFETLGTSTEVSFVRMDGWVSKTEESQPAGCFIVALLSLGIGTRGFPSDAVLASRLLPATSYLKQSDGFISMRRNTRPSPLPPPSLPWQYNTFFSRHKSHAGFFAEWLSPC